jgi:hypothetical protein
VTFPLAPDLAAHIEFARHDHQIHYHARGYVRSAANSRGRCEWRWASDGCVILCWHYDLPGYGLCPHHAAMPLAGAV